MVVPSSISTLDGSPRNLLRWATTSAAMVLKSLTFLARRSVRTCRNPSRNFCCWSAGNSSGEPKAERMLSSAKTS